MMLNYLAGLVYQHDWLNLFTEMQVVLAGREACRNMKLASKRNQNKVGKT